MATVTTNKTQLTRRSFLMASATAAGGLLVSLYLDLPLLAQESGPPKLKVYPPDAFIEIKPDGKIVIQVNRLEFGQGVQTSLPMVLADEMDADWTHVVAELAPAADIYRDPVRGIQMVGGSGSIATSFTQYRELGARTRAMLVAAAAQRWNVSPDQCSTAVSVVHGPAGQSATYAELAADAARQPVPTSVELKQPVQFKLIGKHTRRLDTRAKCDGSLKFGLDLDLPGMKTALVARAPVFGGRVRSIDDSAARSVRGVSDVFVIPTISGGTAVAVVADKFWTAKQARDRLKIEWDLSAAERADSSQLLAKYRELARTPGLVAANVGDIKKMDGLKDRIVAEYDFPYLAHSPMEPLNTTVRFEGDRAEVWAGSQFQTIDHAAIAEVLGLKPEQVTFHTEMAGGGFGRRAVADSHVQREAAEIAKRVRGTPVKLIWTREDDVRGGYYRPLHVHRAEIGIGPDGFPIAFPNFYVTVHHPKVNVPVLWWRSVGHTHSAFVMETLVDELATRAKMDAMAYRRKFLKPDAKKLRAALDLVDAKSAPWRARLPKGHAVGFACHESFKTGVACAAEVSHENGRPRIHRVTMAVDAGMVVNPLSVESQFQGGIVFGLTQLLGAITLRDGIVEQRNFDGYALPYIGDAPPLVDVHIVPSTEAPTGCGEPPVPVIAPAVANAMFWLTGKRIRSLPLRKS